MHIRPFAPDDWQSICEIHDRCKPDEMAGVLDRSAIQPIEHDPATQSLYRQSSIRVIDDGRHIAGFTGTIGRYVSALFVLPEYRTRGFATALMRSVMDVADGPICLNVGKQNATALRLYERLGFATDVEFVSAVSGRDVHVLRMRYVPEGHTGPANPVDYIKGTQRDWATSRGIPFDGDGYTHTIDANLFGGLSEAARNDFKQGDGAELGTECQPGKIQALHSSSALACNWFDWWRGGHLAPLSRAFGMSSPLREFVGLEQKLSTGVGGIGPNLDVMFRCADGTRFGIESKFTEPYRPSDPKTRMKLRYFGTSSTAGLRLWDEAGLPGCQRIAEDLRNGTHHFKTLDVAQLLKHMLGMSRKGQPWMLCYLWYDARGPVADQHRQEVSHLIERLGADASHFQSLTYRELFFKMLPHVTDDAKDQMAYVRERYVTWTD